MSPTTVAGSNYTFAMWVTGLVSMVNEYVIPLLYALAFLFFVAGVVRFFFIESGEEGREKGKQMVIYGLIGFVVLFGVWGIVNLVLNTLTGASSNQNTETNSTNGSNQSNQSPNNGSNIYGDN